jgi:hypothetical protein
MARRINLAKAFVATFEDVMTERHIQETCTEWMALDGWRTIITDPPHLRGLGVTEKGIPDRLHLRYLKGMAFKPAAADVLWIEWKKKGGKAMAHQRTWIETERIRGALVWLAGEDFPASIEGFQAWYRKSGLMRIKI